MRRTPLTRKTPLKAKTGLNKRSITSSPPKRLKSKIEGNKRKSRPKLPPTKTVRKRCDKLLTPIIKLMYPHSILSGKPTEVAHHHVHKSKSNALRYYIPNLIPLTHAEHKALHHNESYWASKIVTIKGKKWFEDLEREKRKTVKCDVHWYLENERRLLELKEQLENAQT